MGEWPSNWNGKSFDNTFWLRNPTVIDERLMDYESGRETGTAEAFAQRAVELRRHFVENFDVQRHFVDRHAPGTRPSRPMTAASPIW